MTNWQCMLCRETGPAKYTEVSETRTVGICPGCRETLAGKVFLALNQGGAEVVVPLRAILCCMAEEGVCPHGIAALDVLGCQSCALALHLADGCQGLTGQESAVSVREYLQGVGSSAL